MNEPTVFVHAAFESQLCVPDVHSSRSRSNKEEGIKIKMLKSLKKAHLITHKLSANINYKHRLNIRITLNSVQIQQHKSNRKNDIPVHDVPGPV